MKTFLISFLVLFLPISLFSQILEFDLLEMNYDQKMYKNVYRKANLFLDNPEYDFSYVPKYYLALTQLQLAQNDRWRKLNKNAINDAQETLLFLQSSRDGQEILRAHKYETDALHQDLILWRENLKSKKETAIYRQIDELILAVFKTEKPKPKEVIASSQKNKVDIEEEEWRNRGEVDAEIASTSVSTREEILEFSLSFLGTPYIYAGMTPQGFDCSGFTSYVMANTAGMNLSHNSTEQYLKAKKIDRKNVQPGDFVFFARGNQIFHVGIVFSLNNDSVQMIHSSTSVGISIVDIYQSDYWRVKIKGFGTYLE